MKFYILMGLIGFALGICGGWMAHPEFPEKPPFKLAFEGFEYPSFKSKKVSLDHIVFKCLGVRFYEFHDTGQIGYIVRYQFISKNPAKPLASHGPIKRDKCGKMQFPYQTNSLCFRVDCNVDYQLAYIVARSGEHWNPDGTIKIKSFGDRDYMVSSDESGFHVLYLRPQDGFFSEGRPMDVPDLHVVEVDLYYHPKPVPDVPQPPSVGTTDS